MDSEDEIRGWTLVRHVGLVVVNYSIRGWTLMRKVVLVVVRRV